MLPRSVAANVNRNDLRDYYKMSLWKKNNEPMFKKYHDALLVKTLIIVLTNVVALEQHTELKLLSISPVNSNLEQERSRS